MTSPLITLPKDVLFIRVLMLDDIDTCKDLASINHSFAIDRIREQYVIRRARLHLHPGAEMCSGCHKNRSTTTKFWRDCIDVITVWLDLLLR
jgi:hypothetical protein